MNIESNIFLNVAPLRRVERDIFYFLATDEKKKYFEELEKEGFEYLLWGYKFADPRDARNEIKEMGYDPDDFRYIAIGEGQQPDLTFIFFFKKLSPQKVAFEVSREPKAWQSRLLREHKEEYFDMESLEWGESFLDELRARGFKRGLISAKIDGESSLLHYKDGESSFYSKKGFIRRYSPLNEKLDDHLKKKKVKELIVIGELYARDDKERPFLPFNVSMSIIKKPKDKKEEDLVSFAVYEFVFLNGKNLLVETPNYIDRFKAAQRFFPPFGRNKYFSMIKAKIVNSVDEVKKFMKKDAKGFEGVVLFVEKEG